MTAKEYLRQLLSIERLIQVKTTERERLMALATKVTSALNDCKVEKSPDNTKTQNIIIKIVNYSLGYEYINRNNRLYIKNIFYFSRNYNKNLEGV